MGGMNGRTDNARYASIAAAALAAMRPAVLRGEAED